MTGPLHRIAPEDVRFLSSIDEIVEDARNGRMFILVDDEDRENEGDLVIPAQFGDAGGRSTSWPSTAAA